MVRQQRWEALDEAAVVATRQMADVVAAVADAVVDRPDVAADGGTQVAGVRSVVADVWPSRDLELPEDTPMSVSPGMLRGAALVGVLQQLVGRVGPPVGARSFAPPVGVLWDTIRTGARTHHQVHPTVVVACQESAVQVLFGGSFQQQVTAAVELLRPLLEVLDEVGRSTAVSQTQAVADLARQTAVQEGHHARLRLLVDHVLAAADGELGLLPAEAAVGWSQQLVQATTAAGGWLPNDPEVWVEAASDLEVAVSWVRGASEGSLWQLLESLSGAQDESGCWQVDRHRTGSYVLGAAKLVGHLLRLRDASHGSAEGSGVVSRPELDVVRAPTDAVRSPVALGRLAAAVDVRSAAGVLAAAVADALPSQQATSALLLDLHAVIDMLLVQTQLSAPDGFRPVQWVEEVVSRFVDRFVQSADSLVSAASFEVGGPPDGALRPDGEGREGQKRGSGQLPGVPGPLPAGQGVPEVDPFVVDTTEDTVASGGWPSGELSLDDGGWWLTPEECTHDSDGLVVDPEVPTVTCSTCGSDLGGDQLVVVVGGLLQQLQDVTLSFEQRLELLEEAMLSSTGLMRCDRHQHMLPAAELAGVLLGPAGPRMMVCLRAAGWAVQLQSAGVSDMVGLVGRHLTQDDVGAVGMGVQAVAAAASLLFAAGHHADAVVDALSVLLTDDEGSGSVEQLLLDQQVVLPEQVADVLGVTSVVSARRVAMAVAALVGISVTADDGSGVGEDALLVLLGVAADHVAFLEEVAGAPEGVVPTELGALRQWCVMRAGATLLPTSTDRVQAGCAELGWPGVGPLSAAAGPLFDVVVDAARHWTPR